MFVKEEHADLEQKAIMSQLQNWLGALKESKLAWWVTVAWGWIFYLRQYASNRALWADEASLAINLVNRTFWGLTQPLDHHQAAPVGFLFIEKFFINIFGNKEYSLRLFPFLAGILSVYIIYRLARDHFGLWGILAVFLVASNNWLSYYASEVKQYGIDVFVALGLTFLATNCLKTSAHKREFLWLGIAGIVAVWISHVSIFILAGIGITFTFEKVFYKKQIPFSWLLALAAGWLISFGLHYLLILRYTAVDEYFQAFWKKSFLPLPPWGNLSWYLNIYYKFLLTLFNRTDPILFYLAPCLSALGLLSLLIRNRSLGLLMLFPFLTILIASALRKYPLTYRFMLFLIPFVFLLIAEGMRFMYQLISKWRKDLAILAYSILVATLLWYLMPITYTNFVHAQQTSDIRLVMEYIGKNRQPTDIVYVFYSSVPTFTYYGPFYELVSGNIVIPAYNENPKLAQKNFFDDVEKLRGSDRVWFLFSDLVDCGGCNGDMRHYFVEYLNEYGTLLDQIEAPGQAGGYLYDLNP